MVRVNTDHTSPQYQTDENIARNELKPIKASITVVHSDDISKTCRRKFIPAEGNLTVSSSVSEQANSYIETPSKPSGSPVNYQAIFAKYLKA
jgi:hypothetical protein